MRTFALGLAGLTVALGGCTTVQPAIPPVLEYAPADCGGTPDLADAISLTPDKDKAVWMHDASIDASAGCVTLEGAATPYLVYELPPRETTKLVELGSVLERVRLFSPRVTLLDEDGSVTRTLNPQSYMFRTGMLSVQFVPTEEEKYALVTANAGVVGESHDSLVASVNTTTIWTGYGASNWNSGAETLFSQGFSYEGQVRALVYRADKD